jgi:hypothetical protein
MPSSTLPLDGSDLISVLSSLSSTKYGPSVCCGDPSISIKDGVTVQDLVVAMLLD